MKELLQGKLAKGISQRKLAKEIGIPLSSLCNYLDTDTEPRIDNLKKIANYFHTPVVDILPKITGSIDATLPPLQAQVTGQLILPPDPYIIQIYNLMQGKTDEEKEAMVAAARETSKTYPQKKQKSA